MGRARAVTGVASGRARDRIVRTLSRSHFDRLGDTHIQSKPRYTVWVKPYRKVYTQLATHGIRARTSTAVVRRRRGFEHGFEPTSLSLVGLGDGGSRECCCSDRSRIAEVVL